MHLFHKDWGKHKEYHDKIDWLWKYWIAKYGDILNIPYIIRTNLINRMNEVSYYTGYNYTNEDYPYIMSKK